MAGTTFTLTLVHESCCVCHVLFAIPSEMQTKLIETHKSFYCPNGHSQSFTGETDAERLTRELKARQADLDRVRVQLKNKVDVIVSLEAQNVTLGRKLSARKGVTTRLQRRITKGQCPCCSKKFKDLKTHMAAEHPSYDVDKEAAAHEAKAGAS